MEALPPIVQQALAPKFLERVQAWVQVAEVHATEELTRNLDSLDILAQR